jgi:hypothetical protein
MQKYHDQQRAHRSRFHENSKRDGCVKSIAQGYGTPTDCLFKSGICQGRCWSFLIFLICIVGGGSKVHSTLRPLNGLLCQPRVIMIMEKSVE